MTIGEKIKKLRKNLEISQIDLADKIQVSKQTLYKYENGIVTNIPSDKLESLADALDTTPEYLMGWTEDPVDYDKLDVDVPTWWGGSVKGYLELQNALDRDRESDSALNGPYYVKDDSERRLLMLCRKAGNASEEEKEALINQFEATIDIYLKAKGIVKE